MITEVPGNPGGSIDNEFQSIREGLVEQFGVDLRSVAWFHVWPAGCLDDIGEWNQIDSDGFRVGKSCTRHTVEELVAEVLPDFPDHVALYGMVVKLGCGVQVELFNHVFEATRVSDLPFPHNPGACQHAARFHTAYAQLPESEDWMKRSLEAGRSFYSTLTREDRAACRYHQADWRPIAEESIRILNQCGKSADIETYLAAISQSSLDERENRWLESLFCDPIFVSDGTYTNGQHRGCAVRFSGAELIAVHVRDESLGLVSGDWTYCGGG